MVKITEELLQKADQIPNFSDGVIMPDGDYRLIEEKGHLQTMMALLPYPEKEIWKMIPENDSALFWMIEKTGCVLTDYNTSGRSRHSFPVHRSTFHPGSVASEVLQILHPVHL